MAEIVMKVNHHPVENKNKFVYECMGKLMEKHPYITGYNYEVVDDSTINILMWGDFEVKDG